MNVQRSVIMLMQMILSLRAFVGSDKVLCGESPTTKKPNKKPERDNVEDITENLFSFWEEHHSEHIKVKRSYNNGTLAFSVKAAGGEYYCYCGLVDTVEARIIDEVLNDMRWDMSA